MSMNSEVDKLNQEKAALQKMVDTAKSIRRLSTNRDFKKLIEEGYFITAASDYAFAAGDLTNPKEDRETTAEMSRAPGHLKRWLSIQLRQADQAENRISQINEEIAEYENTSAETLIDGEYTEAED